VPQPQVAGQGPVVSDPLGFVAAFLEAAEELRGNRMANFPIRPQGIRS
jgi:hypothetical protein